MNLGFLNEHLRKDAVAPAAGTRGHSGIFYHCTHGKNPPAFLGRRSPGPKSLSENSEGRCGEGFWPRLRRRGPSIPVPTRRDKDRANKGHGQKSRRPEGFRGKGRLALLLPSRRSARDILLRRASPYSLFQKNSILHNFQTGFEALFSSVHPAPASWTAPAGFTLIEVLLALMICAIVLVVISTVFAGALRLQAQASANINQSLPIERAMNQLRRDLKNAVPPGGTLAGPMQSGSLAGGVDAGDGIQIYTTTGLMTPDEPWNEIQLVTYGLQPSSDPNSPGKDLVRTVTRNLLSTTTPDEDDQFLASNVLNMSFSYFDGANWLDTWDDTTETNLPVAVRVNLQMAGKDSTQDPPAPMQLLVPLMAQVHTNELDNSGSDTNGVSDGN